MWRKILTFLTLFLAGFVLWQARGDIVQAVGYLASTNLAIIFLLIPEQLFMYYCAGQMFFSYMRAKQEQVPSEKNKIKKMSSWTLARISFELNFVNHAIPSGGVAGLGYMTWRLKGYGATTGQTSFMYVLRYVITILANQTQTVIAILILVLMRAVPDNGWWVIGLSALISVATIAGIAIVIMIASSKKRIKFFAKWLAAVVNNVVKVVTFGRKKQVMKYEQSEDYLMDIYKDLMTARANKKILIHPIIWGVVYSFLEIATYWIVGISMGHPEIMPMVMISEAIASVIGAVMLTPGGVGGYEGAMILSMSTLGTDVGLATAVVITTRVVVLLGTIASGYGFYQNAISTVGKKEREHILQQDIKK